MPVGAHFGFDTVSFTLGQGNHFEGVKDVPDGPHFFYAGSGSELSTRTGYWIVSAPKAPDALGNMFVRRWNANNETLQIPDDEREFAVQAGVSSERMGRLMPYGALMQKSNGIKQSDHHVSAPSTASQISWVQLASFISGGLLSRVTGRSWNKWQISSSDDISLAKPVSGHVKGTSLASLEKGEIGAGDTELAFAFPRTGVTYSTELTGRARTEQARDTSAYVEAMIREQCTDGDSDEVIGELQFCYLSGILLGNMACQEQWAHSIKLLFKAFRLAMDMPLLIERVIKTIHTQLLYDEECMEGSIFDHDLRLQDELRVLLTVFKSRLNEQMLEVGAELSREQKGVVDAFAALETLLGKWDWDLSGNYLRTGKIQLEDGEIVDADLQDFEDEDERGEFAPVIVHLDESGKERQVF
jgi:A1 cistron-splicing factor AAR2